MREVVDVVVDRGWRSLGDGEHQKSRREIRWATASQGLRLAPVVVPEAETLVRLTNRPIENCIVVGHPDGSIGIG